MKNPVNEMKVKIEGLLLESYKTCVAEGLLPEAELLPFDIEQPREVKNGDFSSNFAMKNVRVLRKAPAMIGQMLLEHLPACAEIERAEVAGPGFLNFYLSGAYFAEVAATAAALGADYGKTNRLNGEKIMVEFVSANPTGPMHMGNARGGVVGDSLANVLAWAGADVHKEFYVNNAGNQVSLFGLSLYTRLQQLLYGEDSVEFPENGYHGDDIKKLAAAYLEAHPEAAEEAEDVVTPKLIAYGLENNIARMKSDLTKYKINFDEWFLESTLHESGYVAETVKLLEDRGWMYEQEGAKWFRATEFGCEKDEVLVKANGFYTYYAVDIAYHRNKFEKRRFDRCIDVFGADHHGHTLRFKAAMAAIGQDQEKLQFVLMQLVRLMKDGEPFRMSKRTGKSITLSDLLDEIPADAARFFFNLNRCDSAMDFDLDLALKQDNENPLYYVQYAHARICSIIRTMAELGVTYQGGEVEASLYQSEEERALIRAVANFPEEIVGCAEQLETSRLTHYVMQVAGCFHSFYNACRIKGEAPAVRDARLTLCVAAKNTIANALAVMGIDAPEKM
ncbi:MAG: arginine--tRNA ligase [Clostridia bacterium]|nr:arginine--tRNA ligase [Clostridia bacterium]